MKPEINDQNESWRDRYKKSCPKLATVKYDPCPGSPTCRAVTMRANDKPTDDEGPAWANQ